MSPRGAPPGAERALEEPPKAPKPPRPSAADWRALDVAEVREALDPMIVLPGAEHGLDALEDLEDLGFLDAWLLGVASMVGFGDGEWRHKDVWKHTKQVVRQSVPRLAVRWGALLHDIGKPRTRKIDDRGPIVASKTLSQSPLGSSHNPSSAKSAPRGR